MLRDEFCASHMYLNRDTTPSPRRFSEECKEKNLSAQITFFKRRALGIAGDV
jgi:hypothetical protein